MIPDGVIPFVIYMTRNGLLGYKCCNKNTFLQSERIFDNDYMWPDIWNPMLSVQRQWIWRRIPNIGPRPIKRLGINITPLEKSYDLMK